MTDEYLKTARSQGHKTGTDVSEAELILSNEGLADGFQALQEVRTKINEAKAKALADIDEQFLEELKDAEAQYAMQLSLSRV